MTTLLLIATLFTTDSVASGREVIDRMHARYADTWYESLALVQAVTYFDSLGSVDHAEVWYESLLLPGTVRSDIAPLDEGRGELFRGDSVFRFEADTVVERRPAVHVVLLLGFDVYRQAPLETTSRLERYGFDLDTVREADWNGEPAWLVGSDDGPRFWVDRRDLLVRRLTIPGRQDGPVRDIRFGAYEPLDGGWIATELTFLTDDRVQIRERYAWWAAGMDFAPGLFATRARARPEWVRN